MNHARRAEVEALLRAHAATAKFLASPTAGDALTTAASGVLDAPTIDLLGALPTTVSIPRNEKMVTVLSNLAVVQHALGKSAQARASWV